MKIYKYPKGNVCWLYGGPKMHTEMLTERDIFFLKEDYIYSSDISDAFREANIYIGFRLPNNDRGFTRIVLIKEHMVVIEK